MNMPKRTLAICGATGVVGQQMLKCLDEQNIPVDSLKLLASAASVGQTVEFRGQTYSVELAEPQAFEGVDLVLSAVDDETSRSLLPEAVARGAVCIDNSHAFRMDETVPLVIPEINREDIFTHQGIIANPNCATIIGLMAVYPLHAAAGLTRLVVSTYQAASGAGKAGLAELARELAALQSGESIGSTHPFAHQLAYNLIPQIGGHDEEGYTSEEIKLEREGRKILHMPELRVSCTCVRVPVERSHSESITAEFEQPISVSEARELLQNAPGIHLMDDLDQAIYPMPLTTTDKDFIAVGRIRSDRSAENPSCALSFWCCGDQIRKGAATNAVQIMRCLMEEE